MSPIYPQLKEAGAVFGQSMGYERPNYFDQQDKQGGYEVVNTNVAFLINVVRLKLFNDRLS